MEDAHTKSVEEVIFSLKTDENQGLTDDQVNENQKKYGPNGMVTFMLHANIVRVVIFIIMYYRSSACAVLYPMH